MLATKLYGDMGDWPNDGKLSALNIRRACDASLQRLQTDHIDLYQMHHVDRETPWDEIWQAMDVLVQQGKILYVGSSNFAGWHIAQAHEAAAPPPLVGLVSEQSIYNLLTREVELEVLPAAQAYGLGVIPWSPLHGGLLGGVLRKEREGSRRTSGRAKEQRSSSTAHADRARTRTCATSSARTRRTSRSRGCCTRPGGHRPDHRPAHGRAARRRAARARAAAGRQGAGPAGRDLPGLRHGARGTTPGTSEPAADLVTGLRGSTSPGRQGDQRGVG